MSLCCIKLIEDSYTNLYNLNPPSKSVTSTKHPKPSSKFINTPKITGVQKEKRKKKLIASPMLSEALLGGWMWKRTVCEFQHSRQNHLLPT